MSKNYLTGEELDELNRLTTMFLDFAEDRARRRQQTLMADWLSQTDRFLAFNDRDVLNHAGSVSTSEMECALAERYECCDVRRRAVEAQESASEELDDLAALTKLEREGSGGGDGDGHDAR